MNSPPEDTGRGPGLPRYPDTALSLNALALGAGRKDLHQVAWHHGTQTGPRNAKAATKSRLLAIRIRPAHRDIPLNEDHSLPEGGCWWHGPCTNRHQPIAGSVD